MSTTRNPLNEMHMSIIAEPCRNAEARLEKFHRMRVYILFPSFTGLSQTHLESELVRSAGLPSRANLGLVSTHLRLVDECCLHGFLTRSSICTGRRSWARACGGDSTGNAKRESRKSADWTGSERKDGGHSTESTSHSTDSAKRDRREPADCTVSGRKDGSDRWSVHMLGRGLEDVLDFALYLPARNVTHALPPLFTLKRNVHTSHVAHMSNSSIALEETSMQMPPLTEPGVHRKLGGKIRFNARSISRQMVSLFHLYITLHYVVRRRASIFERPLFSECASRSLRNFRQPAQLATSCHDQANAAP